MIEKGSEYLLTSAKLSKTRDGRSYGIVELVSEVDRIKTLDSFNVWGMEKLPAFPCLAIISNTKPYKDKLSCTISEIQFKACPEGHPLKKYCPTVVTLEEWVRLCSTITDLIPEESLKAVWSDAYYHLFPAYSTHTAARSNHHAYVGGLAQHTYEILKMFAAIYPSLPFPVDPFIVAISCLFHDYGKLSEYDEDFNALPAMNLQGHPFLGAEAVGAFLRTAKYDIPLNLIQHCQHCVLAHHGRLEFGSPVLPASPEAFLVAKLDGLSGHGVMYDVPSGTRTMDTTIYRYKEVQDEN